MNTSLRHLARWSVAIAGIVIVVGFWPSRFGGATTMVVVQGDSMLPTARNGDLLLSRSQRHYEVGDLIVYETHPAPTKVIHRITEVLSDGSFVTQGDNRTTADAVRPTPSDVIGKERFTIPYGGYILWLCSRWWTLGLVTGLLITLRLLRDSQPTTAVTPEPSVVPKPACVANPSIEDMR